MAKRKLSTFERLQKGWLSRKERRELQQRLRSDDPGLEIVHRDAAGIDIGNESHFVAVPAGRDEQPVREFGSWTDDLRRMAAWLKACGIRTVAMQSTGVYWIAAYEVLEQEGLQPYLVNARGTRNLPGRKSDVQECQWLMKLHTYGLLRNSFRPPEQIRPVRTVWRLRERHVQDAGRCVQHWQKALTTMNVQLHNVISDLSGMTGQAIVRAILRGQRDPHQLAKLRDPRIQASEEEIAHSLEGHWRDDVLFELQQAVEAYDFHQAQIERCDQEVQKYMAALPEREAPGCDGDTQAPTKREQPESMATSRRRKPRKNQPNFDVQAELRRVSGVDLTRIDGINVMTAQTILAEVGPDLSAWKSEAQFSSWLGLSPQRDISGGKVIRQPKRRVCNRVTNALRMAASSLERSRSYLGARYRHLKARLGPAKAVKATARYLACLVYRMLKFGQDWVDRGAEEFERKRAERDLAALRRKAAALGMQLAPTP